MLEKFGFSNCSEISQGQLQITPKDSHEQVKLQMPSTIGFKFTNSIIFNGTTSSKKALGTTLSKLNDAHFDLFM
jgi:hypothetical protein